LTRRGLANGITQGHSTIRATSETVTGGANLNVAAPTIVVNEVLADPPAGIDGDANHDGSRDSSQDEFVELANSTDAAINLTGWTVRTRSINSSTESVRHIFTVGTILPQGEAMLVFGGGTFNAGESVVCCAQVVKASSGRLITHQSGLAILAARWIGQPHHAFLLWRHCGFERRHRPVADTFTGRQRKLRAARFVSWRAQILIGF